MSYHQKGILTTLITCTVVACGGGGTEETPLNPVSVPTGTNSPNNIPPADDPTIVSSSGPTDILQEGLIGPLGGSGADGEFSTYHDSPFANLDFSSGYFYFEDFEDNVLEHPGASASHGNFVTLEFGETHHDSVDNDDGLIDGNTLDGESWFYDAGNTGITWTFDAAELGGQLPTHVGIVWTDGSGETTFEAFDSQGQSLGSVVANHANSSFNGESDEDRFYGAIDFGGITSIRISSGDRFNGIEVDHLQWGYTPE